MVARGIGGPDFALGNAQIMKWEYQVVAKVDLGDFIQWLNQMGNDGWEAISGTYVPSGSGLIERPGQIQWVAVMKRQRAN
jgi:hypothetical protein